MQKRSRDALKPSSTVKTRVGCHAIFVFILFMFMRIVNPGKHVESKDTIFPAEYTIANGIGSPVNTRRACSPRVWQASMIFGVALRGNVLRAISDCPSTVRINILLNFIPDQILFAS